MSEIEVTEPYVYQPYGIQDNANWKNKRVFGVGGVSMLATIKGLTKSEANRVVAVLKPEKGTPLADALIEAGCL